MKYYKAGAAAAIAVSMMVAAVFPINVQAMEELSFLSVSGSDAVIIENREFESVDFGNREFESIEFNSGESGTVSAGNVTEETMVTVDVSDMVYQAGGWGTPVRERAIALYAMDEREQLKEEIFNALQNEASSLDVRGYNLTLEDMDDIEILVAEVLNEHPGLFYVKSSIGYSYNEAGEVPCLYFFYGEFTSEEREAYVKKFEQAVAQVTPEMTDVEKALVLHDYLAQHCAYAYTEYLAGTLGSCRNVYSAYGALAEGKAVCQGYALAYSSLLNYVGIESELCRSSSMNHAWNVISVDGEWYHVDVTWDDPVWNREGRARHSYFLLSDTEMGNREHRGWESAVECTSEKYDGSDYWWNAAESQILTGDKQYYIESTGSGFQLTERNKDVSSAKYVNNTVWEVWGNGASYWLGSYAYLSRQGDYIYFNDKLNLYAMKLTDNTPQIIYTYEGGDGYIYGAMVYEDGMARLNIEQLPNGDNDSFITVDLRAEAPVLTTDYKTGIISTTANMEYSLDNGVTWNRCTENMKITDLGWNGIREVTVSFRIPESGGRFTSETTVVTLKALPGTMTGKVTCFGDMNTRTTIQLLDGSGGIVAETAVTGNSAEYVLENVDEGTYTLRASKQNHVTREYTLTVAGEAVTQGVELHLVGDINGDGKINAKDKKELYNHIACLAVLEDYNLAVADANGDGNVNAKDKKTIYNHIAGLSLLW